MKKLTKSVQIVKRPKKIQIGGQLLKSVPITEDQNSKVGQVYIKKVVKITTSVTSQCLINGKRDSSYRVKMQTSGEELDCISLLENH